MMTKSKVKKKNLMNFTRQLGVFVKAGIPITEARTTIGDESTDVALLRSIVEMVEDLRNGGLFSASAAQHPQVFPNYYVGILQAAELTGRLDESLEQHNMAAFLLLTYAELRVSAFDQHNMTVFLLLTYADLRV